jgi:hypothetical protein
MTKEETEDEKGRFLEKEDKSRGGEMTFRGQRVRKRGFRRF